MRVLTLNANGIRSAARKGFFDWLPGQKADVVCVQETKAQAAQLADPVFWPNDYHCYYFDAQTKGYAGTALYARKQPLRVARGFGAAEFDREGRFLEARFAHVNIVSLYLPSGSAGPQRQASKFRFLEAFTAHLAKMHRRRRPTILCGDWNIAHKPIDLKNWRANQKNSGFLPEERLWLDELFGSGRYVDAFRETNGEPEQYTWWSNRGQAYAKNVGWRIDYHVAGAALRGKIRRARICKERRFSDHAPLLIDYDLEL
ncbi:MAG TPA: exodeoxyribonuclease III [Steroidobacteraceae bacterium]|nr:exodeoxyribonuclease III [Steroidobacteraceae bacterium]